MYVMYAAHDLPRFVNSCHHACRRQHRYAGGDRRGDTSNVPVGLSVYTPALLSGSAWYQSDSADFTIWSREVPFFPSHRR